MEKNFVNKISKRRASIVAALAIVALGFIGWQVYKRAFKGNKNPETGRGSFSVAVEIGPIEISSIKDVAQFSGSLIPKTSFTIAPKISGRLNRLFIDIGDMVSQGQLVAVLEDAEYQQQVIQAEADLRVARANLEEARSSLEISKKDLERAKILHQKGIQSDSQLDAALAQNEAQEARYKVAVAQEANKRSALASARVRLSYTQIRASWEKGSDTRYVGERFVNEGSLLSANAPIISIIELQPITAVIYVTDKDYFRLKNGQNATITSTAFPGTAFSGQVARIAPLLKETSREARVEIEIQNPESLLKPGMFINTQIEFANREETTVIPLSALTNRNGQQGVFLADIENKKAYFKPVKVGITQGERAEILEPSPLSGFVVTLGHHLLEDGGNIVLPQTAPLSSDGDTKVSKKPDQGEKKAPGGKQ